MPHGVASACGIATSCGLGCCMGAKGSARAGLVWGGLRGGKPSGMLVR